MLGLDSCFSIFSFRRCRSTPTNAAIGSVAGRIGLAVLASASLVLTCVSAASAQELRDTYKLSDREKTFLRIVMSGDEAKAAEFAELSNINPNSIAGFPLSAWFYGTGIGFQPTNTNAYTNLNVHRIIFERFRQNPNPKVTDTSRLDGFCGYAVYPRNISLENGPDSPARRAFLAEQETAKHTAVETMATGFVSLVRYGLRDKRLVQAIFQGCFFRNAGGLSDRNSLSLYAYRTLEITRNAETGLWHPHVHLLVIVPARYFQHRSGLYIDQPEWAALWRKFARLDYDPVIDVRALKGVGGGPLADLGRKSLAEVTKYCTKPSDLVTFDEDGEPYPVDAEGLKALYDALHGRRLVGMSGALQALAKELRLADPDDDEADLSGADSFPDDAVYLGREFYRWHHDFRDYVCVPRVVWPTQAQEHQMPP